MIRAFVLALFVSSCATPPAPVQSVAWVRASSVEDATRLCKRPYSVLGCQWRKDGICYVVAMDYGGDTLTTLGHELKHCFDGSWHGSGIVQQRKFD